MTQVIVRFAPSPTGMLHIGGARTALFNYLFAKNSKGKFLLRIEDTDKARSTNEAISEILSSLNWLGLKHDAEIIYQSARIDRHMAIVKKLLETGHAYYCYASKEELESAREEAKEKKISYKYNNYWRDAQNKEIPKDIKPVVRIKAPLTGKTEFDDLVQGKITVSNQEIEDFVILRSDGTPTYMLAVMVDDYDMGITHIIRGDDHLANTPKQIILYNALGIAPPIFAHIPLIYGSDGKKLSKRHGATALSEFKNLGYLPEALRNYLLRLGFAKGDAEIISDAEAINWFDFANIGKSPARFDFKKLDFLNSHYLQVKNNDELLKIIKNHYQDLNILEITRITNLLDELKARAQNLEQLKSSVFFLREDFNNKSCLTEKAASDLKKLSEYKDKIISFLQKQSDFSHGFLYEACKIFAEDTGIKMKDIAGFLRIALTASHISPSIFSIMEVLGKAETLTRLKNINS
jgi:glutamyl-tRNA synthetase